MATSRQRMEDEDSEGLGGVIHLPLASYCGKVSPRSPPNRNLDSPPNMVSPVFFTFLFFSSFFGHHDPKKVEVAMEVGFAPFKKFCFDC